jgi:hypothetical protein
MDDSGKRLALFGERNGIEINELGRKLLERMPLITGSYGADGGDTHL